MVHNSKKQSDTIDAKRKPISILNQLKHIVDILSVPAAGVPLNNIRPLTSGAYI